ncbi:hypothetical protein G5V59_06120 [Nocardioides sp. W3-2-3]|uniref:hypothetical protein n=1 Tax=Nocardioides convexus TaxID=2712224 RepID=UPI00241831C8|nr:hypothetical protein [Nocardioides convexus]NGZ99958.1 hypothetical protein [Nocardioides convexus]
MTQEQTDRLPAGSSRGRPAPHQRRRRTGGRTDQQPASRRTGGAARPGSGSIRRTSPRTTSPATSPACSTTPTRSSPRAAPVTVTCQHPLRSNKLIRNLRDTNGGGNGEIDIIKIGEGDDARYIVNLPGTDTFPPGSPDARDGLANLQADRRAGHGLLPRHPRGDGARRHPAGRPRRSGRALAGRDDRRPPRQRQARSPTASTSRTWSPPVPPLLRCRTCPTASRRCPWRTPATWCP